MNVTPMDKAMYLDMEYCASLLNSLGLAVHPRKEDCGWLL